MGATIIDTAASSGTGTRLATTDSVPVRCRAAPRPSNSSPALTAAVPHIAGRQHHQARRLAQLLEVEHREGAVRELQAGEHRVVGAERAVAGEMGDLRSLQRGEHRVHRGARRAEGAGVGIHRGQRLELRADTVQPRSRREDDIAARQRRRRRRTAFNDGTTDTARRSHDGNADQGSACRGPVGQTMTGASSRTVPTKGTTSASSRRTSESSRKPGGLVGSARGSLVGPGGGAQRAAPMRPSSAGGSRPGRPPGGPARRARWRRRSGRRARSTRAGRPPPRC